MLRRLRRRLIATALALGAAPPLLAHDMWIEPTTFVPGIGQVVGAKLRVGVDLVGDALPRSAALIEQFVVVDAAGRQPLPGRERVDPAGVLSARVPGLSVVGYHSRPSRVAMEPDKFDAYLKEEGLDDIRMSRSADASRRGATREQFFRCAKSLLQVGAPTEAQGDRVLGFPLELVAERNPYLQGPDDDLAVRLTYEGQPLAGALVVAIRRAGAVDRIAARSDADGRVRLRLKGAGMWLIKAVHMVPVALGAESGVDWSSYWASLTFELREPGMDSGR